MDAGEPVPKHLLPCKVAARGALGCEENNNGSTTHHMYVSKTCSHLVVTMLPNLSSRQIRD